MGANEHQACGIVALVPCRSELLDDSPADAPPTRDPDPVRPRPGSHGRVVYRHFAYIGVIHTGIADRRIAHDNIRRPCPYRAIPPTAHTPRNAQIWIESLLQLREVPLGQVQLILHPLVGDSYGLDGFRPVEVILDNHNGSLYHVGNVTSGPAGHEGFSALSGIDRSWTIRRTEAPLELERGNASTGTGTATQGATVTIEGDPLDLLVVISRRRPRDEATQCTVVGDRAELDHFVDHMVWVDAA